MQVRNTWLPHHNFTGGNKQRIPYGVRRNTSSNQFHSLVARVIIGSLAEDAEHVASGALIELSTHPICLHVGDQLHVPPPWPVGRFISESRCRVLHVVI